MINVFIPYRENFEICIEALEAFAKGLKSNYKILDLFKGYKKCDIAILFGVNKPTSSNGVINGKIFQQHKGIIVVVEVGFIKRDKYFMVGLNGLNGYADFLNQNSPSDRWELLEVILKDKNQGENILICGQKKRDSSILEIDYQKWLDNTIEHVIKNSDRKILYKPHPLERNKLEIRPNKKFKIDIINELLEICLKNSWCTIAYNSNAGVDSIINGVPTFSFGGGSMVREISNHNILKINNPYFPTEEKRLQWAYNIAYSQWTIEEMKNSLPQQHIKVY